MVRHSQYSARDWEFDHKLRKTYSSTNCQRYYGNNIDISLIVKVAIRYEEDKRSFN